MRGSGDQGLPSFQNYGFDGLRITLHHQAIIPSYEFQCCGNITEWGVDVQPGGGGDDMRYTLDLQVWRPSPTVDDSTGAGQYNLVGNNRFTSIPLDNDVAEVTPLSRNQVQFRSGDVLGFYVEEARTDGRGINVLTSASYSNERVWYASVTTLNTMGSPVSAGGSGVLNTELRGAPVISIASGDCVAICLNLYYSIENTNLSYSYFGLSDCYYYHTPTHYASHSPYRSRITN